MNGPLLQGTERIAISLVLHKPDTGRKPAWEIRSIRLAISPLSSDLMLPTSECFQKKGTGSPGLGFAVCCVLCLRTLMGPIWFWAKKELRNYSFWQDTRNMTSFLVGLLGREAYSTHAVSARCWGSTEEMCMGFSFFFFWSHALSQTAPIHRKKCSRDFVKNAFSKLFVLLKHDFYYYNHLLTLKGPTQHLYS